MLKTFVGYVFTDHPIRYLSELGFTLKSSDETLKNGYRQHLCFLSPDDGLGLSIEIREILDENLYFQFDPKKKFAPFEKESTARYIQTDHPNSAYCVYKIINEHLENGELKHFLKIRKLHPTWALWIKCKNIIYFEDKMNDVKKVKLQNHDALLIRLGETCFDLLISK